MVEITKMAITSAVLDIEESESVVCVVINSGRISGISIDRVHHKWGWNCERNFCCL